MKLVEVQAMCRIYIEAGVMDPGMVVLACIGTGEYPVLLIHEDIRKHVDAEQAKVLERCSVKWLLEQDSNLELSGAENAFNTAALQFFNTNVYTDKFSAEEDPDLWRLDAIQPLNDDNEQLGVVKIDDICGFGISGLGEQRTLFTIFGKANAITKKLKSGIEEREHQNGKD